MCSKVMDFLTDDDFINYVLGVTPQSASQWETYFREHPEEMADAEEAKAVLLAPANVDCGFSIVENNELKDRIISSIKDDSDDEVVNINLRANKEKWISKLIERHKENLLFEQNNPYTPPTPKKKQVKRGKIVKYKTHDLITGEDAYLLENTKTKKHVIRKNPDALDKIKKSKVEIPLNMMTFNFSKK